MAVKDIILIKYWIPKLDFTVRLGTSQYFKVMYKIYTDDWNNDTGWTVLREQYLVQPDGTTSESDKLVLSNPDRTLLYVDDIFISENRGFVPFNQMKLTIAGWFPTMPVAYRVTEDENGDQVKTAIGVTDRDGIHVTPGSVITILDDTANTSIGTWAGTQANWQICQMEVQSVEYLKYNAGESIVLNGKTSHITEEPMTLGESFLNLVFVILLLLNILN